MTRVYCRNSFQKITAGPTWCKITQKRCYRPMHDVGEYCAATCNDFDGDYVYRDGK